MNVKLSSQARHWLTFFYQNPGLRINYLTLMDLGVPRRKSLLIMRELRDSGALVQKRSRFIGSSLELTTVVSPVSTVTAVQPVSYISNSNTASTTGIATNKFLDGVEGKENEMGYEWFEKTSGSDTDDDTERERLRHMAAKKAEYQESRERTAQRNKDKHRSKLDPKLWTCKDVAYEFAERMSNIWSIKPFSVTQSRFVQALSGFRKQHDTDGEVELEIINLFFSSLQAEKYTDGNHLWRAFMYKAPLLLQSARERVVSVEDREVAISRDEEAAGRKLSIFDEDDDV